MECLIVSNCQIYLTCDLKKNYILFKAMQVWDTHIRYVCVCFVDL